VETEPEQLPPRELAPPRDDGSSGAMEGT